MLPAAHKPVLETRPAASSTANDMHVRSFLGSYASPSSPKTNELRARFEALYTTRSDFKSLKSASFIQ